jgi:hypothetical protein
MSDTRTPEKIAELLAAPFPENEVKWRKGPGGRMLPYLTAASVVRRLNEVCGLAGWWDRYKLLPDGSVMCRLTILVGGHWVSREDVGEKSRPQVRRRASSPLPGQAEGRGRPVPSSGLSRSRT